MHSLLAAVAISTGMIVLSQLGFFVLSLLARIVFKVSTTELVPLIKACRPTIPLSTVPFCRAEDGSEG
jgi:hypothetical protein